MNLLITPYDVYLHILSVHDWYMEFSYALLAWMSCRNAKWNSFLKNDMCVRSSVQKRHRLIKRDGETKEDERRQYYYYY